MKKFLAALGLVAALTFPAAGPTAPEAGASAASAAASSVVDEAKAHFPYD